MSDEQRTPEEGEVEGQAFKIKGAYEEPKTEQVKAKDRAPDPEGGDDEVVSHGSRFNG